MATEPEHVRPGPQPQPCQLGAATQRPSGADELGHMGQQPVEVVQVVGVEATVEPGAEALSGLGGVLGDVAGHLLGRQLPRLAVAVPGEVADVELLAPTGIPFRPTVLRSWTGHADSRDRLPDSVLEEVRREAGRRWGQAARTATLGCGVDADDGDDDQDDEEPGAGEYRVARTS